MLLAGYNKTVAAPPRAVTGPVCALWYTASLCVYTRNCFKLRIGGVLSCTGQLKRYLVTESLGDS